MRIAPSRDRRVNVEPVTGPLAQLLQNPTWIVVFEDMFDPKIQSIKSFGWVQNIFQSLENWGM